MLPDVFLHKHNLLVFFVYGSIQLEPEIGMDAQQIECNNSWLHSGSKIPLTDLSDGVLVVLGMSHGIHDIYVYTGICMLYLAPPPSPTLP